MLVYDQSLQTQCDIILESLSNRDRAMFRRIGYLASDARDKCCYSKIENLGATLKDYGYKAIGRTQAKESFRNVKGLGLFDLTQPHRRAAYRIKLNTLGYYLYHVLVKRITNLPLQKPTFETSQNRPSKLENPTLLDQERFKKKDHLNKILPSTTSEHCNYTNKDGSFSTKIQEMLDMTPKHVREQIEYEYKNYTSTHEVTNKDKVMETIARRIITTEAEYQKVAEEDRQRSLRMQAETLSIIARQNSIDMGSKEDRVAMSKKYRLQMKQALANY